MDGAGPRRRPTGGADEQPSCRSLNRLVGPACSLRRSQACIARYCAGEMTRSSPLRTGATAMRRAGGASMAWLDRRLGSDFATGLRLGLALAPRVASGRFRGRVVLAGILFGSGRWRRPVKLQLDAPSGQIDFIVPDYAALKALGQVFVDRKYDVATEQDPRSILDLGAHSGVSA